MAAKICFLVLLLALPASAKDNEVRARYEKKFALVLREGLAVGLCSRPEGLGPAIPPELAVRISGEASEYHEQTGLSAMGCGSIVPEPLAKGEVVGVQRVWSHGSELHLVIVSEAHEVERTAGARYEIKRRRTERGLGDLRFKNASLANVATWLKPFDSAAEAVAAGKAALSEGRTLKVGMTIAEVEAILGPPLTRADLGEKVLYRYKDLTVEFGGGKVVDVR
jgi:hypothetical protein